MLSLAHAKSDIQVSGHRHSSCGTSSPAPFAAHENLLYKLPPLAAIRGYSRSLCFRTGSHCQVGVNFLALLARSGVGGGILADEMGLGKTAQAITFLGALPEHYTSCGCSPMVLEIVRLPEPNQARAGIRAALDGDAGPHIVVAPASLLENWQRELARWCPGLKVVLYYGRERGDLRQELLTWRYATWGMLRL